MWKFYKALLKNPRSVGAILPSSHFLARTIAQQVTVNEGKSVLELGPGTGAVTKALVERIAPEQLVAVEYHAGLAKQLQRKFPGIRVIHGDAMQLSQMPDLQEHTIQSIVSSLPLLSFTQMMQATVMAEMAHVLEPGGQLIQFSYGRLAQKVPALKKYFTFERRIRVWRNLPPARVYVFKKRAGV